MASLKKQLGGVYVHVVDRDCRLGNSRTRKKTQSITVYDVSVREMIEIIKSAIRNEEKESAA